jgi:hypothetical protein
MIAASRPQATPVDELAKGITKEDLVVSRIGQSDRVPLTLWKQPARTRAGSFVLLLSPNPAEDGSTTLIRSLVKNGHNVAAIKFFPGGRQVPGNIKFFTTYNRTDEANRIQDILTAIAYLKKHHSNERLNVVAQGQAGLWALLARGFAPKIDKMVIDSAQFGNSGDEEFLKYLPIPGIRRAGDLTTAVAIAPLSSLLIHNTGNKFRTEQLTAIYRRFGRAEDFKSQPGVIDNPALIAWLSSK